MSDKKVYRRILAALILSVAFGVLTWFVFTGFGHPWDGELVSVLRGFAIFVFSGTILAILIWAGNVLFVESD